MLSRLRPVRVAAALLAASLIQALLAASVAACSNGNGFPVPGM